MVNKKWAVKRLTVNLTSTERQKLEQYCAKTGRPFNDVIRELLRCLKVYTSVVKLTREDDSLN
ncbi:CopG family transcriptional regulator [Nostoc sp. UCD121]|uniref:CopG family transcriptional regulator n=1 Tax=unclassified Nostoc TaxID=2593658 RepID=UPI0016243011|nr:MULTISPECIES: CopG family transcriptional regulator [unclassified Nostoc]MBC1221523.1 CopG family transcriptional regulator [Nostoc sp. UCD120]MBC1281228.1 CopG family transcriptional regulator [Nostoc sp. UCD121]MBC1299938.1 CopG family transcriptional regulator [Nostoc sp. UCD122]